MAARANSPHHQSSFSPSPSSRPPRPAPRGPVVFAAGALCALLICALWPAAAPAQDPSTPPEIQFQKSLGGSGRDVAWSAQQTADGGFIVAGASGSNDGDVGRNRGKDDFWVVRLNPEGELVWQKSLGGSGWEEAYSVQQTADGGHIVAGYSQSNDGDAGGNHGKNDFWVVKLGPPPESLASPGR